VAKGAAVTVKRGRASFWSFLSKDLAKSKVKLTLDAADSCRGLLRCDTVGYQRFGGPCCLHLQCEVYGAYGLFPSEDGHSTVLRTFSDLPHLYTVS